MEINSSIKKMTSLRKKLFLLALLFASICQSQQSLSSDSMLDYIKNNIKTGSDTVTLYFNELNTRNLDSKTEGQKSLQEGYYSRQSKNNVEAINYFKTSLTLAQKNNFDTLEARSLYEIGLTYHMSGFDDQAADAFFDVLQLGEKKNNEILFPSAWMKLGNIFKTKRQFELSKSYYQRVLIQLTNKDGGRRIAQIEHNIAEIYFELEKLDSAAMMYFSIIEKCEKIGYKPLEYAARSRLASVFLKQGNLPEAENYALEANAHFDILKSNFPSMINVKNLLGNINTQKKKHAVAERYYDSALRLATLKKRNTQRIKIYKSLSDHYHAKQDYKKSHYYLDKQNKLQDSINLSKTNQSIQFLNTLYETQEKNATIQGLQDEKTIQGLELTASRRKGWIALLGVLFLTLFSILIFISLKQKKKSEKLLKEKNNTIKKALSDKELLLREIHHRVKNNLQVVYSLLSLQSEYIKEESVLSAINDGRNRVRSMALIHQNLYGSENLTGVDDKVYLEKLIQELFESYKIEKYKVTLDLDIEDISIDIDTMVPLGLVVNELITNALKHAFNSQDSGIIKATLNSTDTSIVFKVMDNGLGMDPRLLEEKNDSFGLQMIKSFVDKLDGTLHLDSENGTEITLVIPNQNMEIIR